MEDEWKSFDILSLVKSKPRVVLRRFYEINPLGEVRYLDLTNEPKYVMIKPVKINDKEFFMATVGWVRGCQVVVRKSKDELVKRFFAK